MAVLDAATSEVRTLMSGAGSGRYASTGHLVYGSEGGLYAVPFDLDRLAIAGTPSRVVDDVHQIPPIGLTFYSLSDTGTLSYLPSRAGFASRRSLSWVDRTGRSNRLPMPIDDYARLPRSLPTGARLPSRSEERWWCSTSRPVADPRSRGADWSAFAVWASGGKSLVYGSQQGSAADFNLYRREAAGVEAAELLAGESGDELPSSIHGDKLLYDRFGGAGGCDIYTLDLDDPAATAAPLISTAEDTGNGQFSPDGRWVAYEVWEEGLPEVWVEPYPTDGRRRKISGENGASPPSGRPPSARSSTSRMAGA